MTLLNRSYYQASTSEFLSRGEAAILGELVSAQGYAVDALLFLVIFQERGALGDHGVGVFAGQFLQMVVFPVESADA